jgi:hypothetical protein
MTVDNNFSWIHNHICDCFNVYLFPSAPSSLFKPTAYVCILKIAKDGLSAYFTSSYGMSGPFNKSFYALHHCHLFLEYGGKWLDLRYGSPGVWICGLKLPISPAAATFSMATGPMSLLENLSSFLAPILRDLSITTGPSSGLLCAQAPRT